MNPSLSETEVCEARRRLPRLPAEVRARLRSDLGLTEVTAGQLVSWPPLLQYFTCCLEHQPASPREVASLIFSWVQQVSSETGKHPLDIRLSPGSLVTVSNMRQDNTISAGGLQDVITRILEGDDRNVLDIVTQENLFLIRDQQYIEQFAKDIVTDNKHLVEKFRNENNPKKSKRTYQKLINIVNKDDRVDKVDMVLFTQKFNKMLKDS